MKTCSKCTGPVEPKYERYGRVCRACRTRENTRRNRERPHLARAAGARYRATNPNYPLQRRQSVWKKQGIRLTIAEYDAMLKAQGGRCAICRSSSVRNGSQKVLHVDHDHDFGHVRGLLCSPCNKALGGFRDSPSLLRAAARYVERHSPQLQLTQGAAP